eukprot:gene17734-15375_t
MIIGQTYDARLETPGWDSDLVEYTTKLWTTVPVINGSKNVENSIMPATMESPSEGVYIFDFLQNGPGWCRLSMTSEAGVVVQLRHAEVMQHPPYGPEDGNIYVGNLRSAKATDVYVFKGDPDGEVEFSFTQHGFRYVEITFPGSVGLPGPTMESLEFIVVRSSVDVAGDLTVSDSMLQKVHHNYFYGQASNLMMNGAVACWVPGGVGHSSPRAGGSCDASWGSAFPSVVYALTHWNGDVLAPTRYWTGLTRFVDNEYSRTRNSTNPALPGDVKNIFSGLGDWVPAPKSNDNPAFVPEPRGDSKYAAGVAFLRNVRQMVEMATVGGLPKDQISKYQNMFTEVCGITDQKYASGSQTDSVLALEISECIPAANVKAAVVARLAAAIKSNDYHTTSGIIGWRFAPEALSNNGHASLAYALMTQTTYPSIGYEIIGKTGEPATTLWELWDSDAEGPKMNSRNHIMFGGNGKWLHTYVGGIANAPGSVGFDHVWLAPPGDLLLDAVKAVTIPNSTSSSPLTWGSASQAGSKGAIAHTYRLVAGSSPSSYAGLSVIVEVPANAVGTTVIPLLGAAVATCTITEGAVQLWNHGAKTGNAVNGITAVSLVQNGTAVRIDHGSGAYSFVLTF